MNFKRTIAGISALCLVGAVSFTAGMAASPKGTNAAANLFGDINGDEKIDAKDASVILSYYSYLSTTSENVMSLEEFMINGRNTKPETPDREVKLKTGGDKFTVVAWNADDAPTLIANWLGLDPVTIMDELADDHIEGVDLVVLGTSGSMASERYDQMFNSGADMDVYFAEPEWALKYLNDDSRSAPLSDVGITLDDTKDMYPYTVEQCKDSNGVLKAAAWYAAPGCFAYRADFAEKYLDVKNPEEMQAAIGNWDDFVSAAQTISRKTLGEFALADTVNGMWTAYSHGRSAAYVKDGTINIDDDAKDFADKAKTLWECSGVTKNSQWTDEWIDAGRTGACMGYFVSSWGLDGFFVEAAGGVNGETYGKWAVCEGPAPYYWGGTMMLVNPATDNAEEARDFILASAFNKDNLKKYASQLTNPVLPNSMTVSASLAEDNFTYSQTISQNFGGQNYFAVLDKNARAIDLTGKITPYDDAIEADIIYGLYNDYISKGIKGKSLEQTSTDIKKKIQTDCPSLK
ncbi:MAG: carbohydrate ABC transporter substrate-binding protein [Ruminococcus sp.]|nr:carbohydrate ABC transporter substrate-binding protein [Ruminococcus sp.]